MVCHLCGKGFVRFAPALGHAPTRRAAPGFSASGNRRVHPVQELVQAAQRGRILVQNGSGFRSEGAQDIRLDAAPKEGMETGGNAWAWLHDASSEALLKGSGSKD